jgi:hypothetical protein
MKGFLFPSLLVFLCPALEVQASEVLVTPSYRVTVTEHCAEGIVGCSDVSYVGVNTKTGKSIRLSGKAVMVMCADGVTPCHLGYYEFTSGAFRYSVFPNGRLTVEKGGKLQLTESGNWQQ